MKNNLALNKPYNKLVEVLDLIDLIKEKYNLDIAFDNIRVNYYCVLIKLNGQIYKHPYNTYQGAIETLKLLIELKESEK